VPLVVFANKEYAPARRATGRRRVRPARYPRRHHPVVRAHPPLQPDRDGVVPLVFERGPRGRRWGSRATKPSHPRLHGIEAASALICEIVGPDGTSSGFRWSAASTPRMSSITSRTAHPAIRAAAPRSVRPRIPRHIYRMGDQLRRTGNSPRSEWPVIAIRLMCGAWDETSAV